MRMTQAYHLFAAHWPLALCRQFSLASGTEPCTYQLTRLSPPGVGWLAGGLRPPGAAAEWLR